MNVVDHPVTVKRSADKKDHLKIDAHEWKVKKKKAWKQTKRWFAGHETRSCFYQAATINAPVKRTPSASYSFSWAVPENTHWLIVTVTEFLSSPHKAPPQQIWIKHKKRPLFQGLQVNNLINIFVVSNAWKNPPFRSITVMSGAGWHSFIICLSFSAATLRDHLGGFSGFTHTSSFWTHVHLGPFSFHHSESHFYWMIRW